MTCIGSPSPSHLDEGTDMKVRSTDFRVEEGQKVNLDKWPTAVEPIYESKKQYQKLLKKHVEELSSLQQLLYASSRYALLLIFQAMDAAGKDGAIRHVMSGVNPQGCQVFSYKHPSAMELQHDFLWRTTRDLPERGRIGIFNRSYYEEVLIVRVHPEILRSEGIADGSHDEKTVWESRFRAIVGWKDTCPATALGLSNSICTCRKTSSASAFFSELMNRTRIGNSALPMLRRERSGAATCRLLRSASVRQALGKHPGMSFPPTTKGSALRPAQHSQPPV